MLNCQEFNKKTTEIIFIGTAEFAAAILKALIKYDWPIKLIITQPDKPVGRRQILTPPAVKEEALKHNLPILQPVKISDALPEIKKISPDLIIVAAYGQIIPKEILDLAKYGSLNIHASLLPKYRGASPIQGTILAGDKETGVTIMLMDEKMDHGPIVAQRQLEFSIFPPTRDLPKRDNFSRRGGTPPWRWQFSNYKELEEMLAELGVKLLIEIIPKWIKGEIKPRPQDETKATYTKILTKEDGKINWQNSAEIIERQIRAYSPWPDSWTEMNVKGKMKKLKIIEIKILETEKPNAAIGKLFLTKNKKLAVTCGQGSLILEKVQLEGKKETSGADFYHGYSQVEKLF